MIYCSQCFDDRNLQRFSAVCPQATCSACGTLCLGYDAIERIERTYTVSEVRELVEALYQAQADLCSEFCGPSIGVHHSVCTMAQAALAKFDAGKGSGDSR